MIGLLSSVLTSSFLAMFPSGTRPTALRDCASRSPLSLHVSSEAQAFSLQSTNAVTFIINSSQRPRHTGSRETLLTQRSRASQDLITLTSTRLNRSTTYTSTRVNIHVNFLPFKLFSTPLSVSRSLFSPLIFTKARSSFSLISVIIAPLVSVSMLVKPLG